MKKPNGTANLKARMNQWIEYVEQPQSLADTTPAIEDGTAVVPCDGERYLDIAPETMAVCKDAGPSLQTNLGQASADAGLAGDTIQEDVSAADFQPSQGSGHPPRYRGDNSAAPDSAPRHQFLRHNNEIPVRPEIRRRNTVAFRSPVGSSGDVNTGRRQTILLLIIGLVVAGSSAVLALWFIH